MKKPRFRKGEIKAAGSGCGYLPGQVTILLLGKWRIYGIMEKIKDFLFEECRSAWTASCGFTALAFFRWERYPGIMEKIKDFLFEECRSA